MLIPLFKSHYSIHRSILTLDKPSEIKENSSVSIFSIAKKHDLKELFVLENSMSGFHELVNNGKDFKIHFGLSFMITNCFGDKTEESKISIWAKNTKGCDDLMLIHNKAHTEYLGRLSWDTLEPMWTDNLHMTIPFYDSFIHNNLTVFNSQCIPRFFTKPTFFIEDHNLPHDAFTKESVLSYCDKHGYETQDTFSVYFYKKSDFLAYNTFRCIDIRTTLEMPNLEQFGSQEFSFEHYLDRI